MVREDLQENGFVEIENVFSAAEISDIIKHIESKELSSAFGQRAFLRDQPEIAELIFNEKFKALVKEIAQSCKKSIKSIYFDKPKQANWIVNWHQDLTINLRNKIEYPDFKNWREVKNRTTVQPPLYFLENIFTIRIHLDDCTRENGALRVIPRSHSNGVIDIKTWSRTEDEHICELRKGGVLIMKPLILHSSRRTENLKNRRVIHVEFTNLDLPEGLDWYEKVTF